MRSGDDFVSDVLVNRLRSRGSIRIAQGSSIAGEASLPPHT